MPGALTATLKHVSHAPESSALDGTGSTPQSHGRTRWRLPGWIEFLLTIVLALLLALFVKTYLVQVFYIPSGSMEQTLNVGDRVAVNRLAYRIGEPQRGDVVVFDGAGTFAPDQADPTYGNPIEALLAGIGQTVGLVPPPDTVFVKRLIGVGGDHVKCCDPNGAILVNDQPLDEPYIYPGDLPSEQPFDVVVPEGHMWLMGDHRAASADARSHLGDPGGGMVPVDKAIGRVAVVIWPPSEWARVPSISSVQN